MVRVDQNVPEEDLIETAILFYDGDDAPFSIRGPYSKTQFHGIRTGWSREVCCADAKTLSKLPGFGMRDV